MEKSDVLNQLRAAKEAHVSWVQKAKLLINGFTVDKNAIPINSTECKFGKWFYSDGQKLNALHNNPMECMQSIESLHFELHDIYMKIFKIYYEMDERSLLAKLFGVKNKISQANKELAHVYYDEMESVSSKLIEEINRMERRILAVSDEEMQKMY